MDTSSSIVVRGDCMDSRYVYGYTHIQVLYATVYICSSQGEPHLAYACLQQARALHAVHVT